MSRRHGYFRRIILDNSCHDGDWILLWTDFKFGIPLEVSSPRRNSASGDDDICHGGVDSYGSGGNDLSRGISLVHYFRCVSFSKFAYLVAREWIIPYLFQCLDSKERQSDTATWDKSR